MTQLASPETLVAPPRPVRRYAVRRLSGPLHWGIWDEHLGAWCALPNGSSLIPLEWHSEDEAQAWLYRCRVAWGAGYVDAPDGWNAR